MNSRPPNKSPSKKGQALSGWALPKWLQGSRRQIPQAENIDLEQAEIRELIGPFKYANNLSSTVLDLVRPVLENPPYLIATGYQDFLSALSIILELRPGLSETEPGAIRLLFGTNTETSHKFVGSDRALSEEARQYFLGRSGLSLDHEGDLRAVLAREAVAAGIIDIRVFDADLAKKDFRRRPGMLHSKMIVGKDAAIMGSANFTRNGLRYNVEHSDRFEAGSEAYEARKQDAELLWNYGRDWNKEALEILDGLLRITSPEEAASRAVSELKSFAPWRVNSSTESVGRPPQPFQAQLIYEANATIYEHGFTFLEAPTGAGKTDIGKHLGATLPYMYDRVVLEIEGAELGHRRKGSFAIVPTRVYGNWKDHSPTGLRLEKLSSLSKDVTKTPEQFQNLSREFQNSTAVIVDECHLVNSRWLGDSARAKTFDESPAIWSACLSATLLGNQGLDGLLAFHEKRASIYMSPEFTKEMNDIFVRENARQFGDLAEDLFGKRVPLARPASSHSSAFVTTLEAQHELSSALAPFVCRRERTCVGETKDRSKLAYPPVVSRRLDANVGGRRGKIISEISQLAAQITRGLILTSPEHSRMGQTRVTIHDSERVTVRNFLSLLRSSTRFAYWSWFHGKIGQRMRAAESGERPGRGTIADQPDFGLFTSSTTPKCDRIQELLNAPELLSLDEERAQAMRNIVDQHGQVIFLSERVPVLQFYAELLQRSIGDKGEVYSVVGQPDKKMHRGLFEDDEIAHSVLQKGEQAQELMANDGSRTSDVQRAVFMTYQRAEGVNLQRASALGMIGVTSNTKNMIQGMGRIDRIDSPHAEITYYTFDLPGLSLPSDEKARSRVLNNLVLSGTKLDEGALEAELPSAGDLTDRIIELKHQKRNRRREHFYDTVGLLREELNEETFKRVSGVRPSGVWGTELCILDGATEFSLFVLGGRSPHLGHASVFAPPRLLAIVGDQVIRAQVECGNLLLDAYRESVKAGLHHEKPSASVQDKMLNEVQQELLELTHWDTRPERTVSLLSSLSGFLEPDTANDLGRGLLGDLTLPALEYLADIWASELDPSWIRAKRNIREHMQAGRDTPNYLGIDQVMEELLSQQEDQVRATKKRMMAALESARTASDGKSLGIADRVSVVFRCNGSAS